MDGYQSDLALDSQGEDDDYHPIKMLEIQELNIIPSSSVREVKKGNS